MTEWTVRGTDDAGSFVETIHTPDISSALTGAFDARVRQGRSDITIAYCDPLILTYSLEPCWP